MHDESIYALRVLRVGAKAYVMKQDAAESVVDAIRWVRKGQLYVSEFVASQMLNRYAQGEQLGDDSAVSCLSDRELEVLNLIGSGVSTREIAARLLVSIKTVETHRAHIKSKLNLGSAFATDSVLRPLGWIRALMLFVLMLAGSQMRLKVRLLLRLPWPRLLTSRKFAPARSITTLVRTRSRSISTQKAG